MLKEKNKKEIINQKEIEIERQTELNLNQSDKEWKIYKKLNSSIVDEIFAGQMISIVNCKRCGNISETFDPFLDLSLPIPSKSFKKSHTINECLKQFFKEEELPNDYQCEKCKRKSKVFKSLKISKSPNTLVLHLKRFKMFPKKIKINDKISFPLKGLSIDE